MLLRYLLDFFIFFLGLSIGSFLNVVIYRIPNKESIVSPPSHCPFCGHRLRIWENIPIISYIFLKGRCSSCNSKISIQYPLIEFLTAILFLFVFIKFQWSIQTIIYFGFTAILIVLSLIDLHTKLLPDIITLPAIIIACFISLLSLVTSLRVYIPFNPRTSLLGMLAGAGPLILISFLYYKITGREGLGGGDIKLMILVGIVLGPFRSLLTLLLASILGSLIGIPLTFLKGGGRQTEIPFGPYLSVSAWISMMWGSEFINWYLHYSGLSR